MSEQKIKLQQSIGIKAFIGFVVAINLFFITTVGIPTDSWKIFIGDSKTKFLLYVDGISILLCLGITRPSFNKFFSELVLALRDFKLSAEERLHLIEVLKDEFLGNYADLTIEVAKKNEKPIEPLP
jgi:hypothetical protein